MTFKKISRILVFLFFINATHAQNIDVNILKDINLGRDRSLDGTFQFFSNSAAPIGVGAPIVIYVIGMINKDATIKQKGLFIGEAFLTSAIITTALKIGIKRERPFNTYPEIDDNATGGGFSFPSGHTSSVFSTATSLSMAFPKWYVIAPSFAWASVVAYSRMDLGVHYPSDVLGGMIVGSGTAYLTYKLNKWINKKTEKKYLFEGTN
jgi:membrane-associated phospholipid phosphatase